MQVLNERSIAVSKLCCLVCWDLLKVLRGDTLNYAIRGHHCGIHGVELPAWLPVTVLREMVMLYGNYLRRELRNLWEVIQKVKEADRRHRKQMQYVSECECVGYRSTGSASSHDANLDADSGEEEEGGIRVTPGPSGYNTPRALQPEWPVGGD